LIGPHRIQSLHEAVRAERIMALAHGTAGAIAAG
jgi:hypothetical protein